MNVPRTRIFRHLVLSLLILAAPCLTKVNAEGPAQKPGWKLPPGAVEYMVPMRDGAKLATNVFLPKGDGPFAVVLTRTPYGKDEKQLAMMSGRYGGHGLAFVIQDCRGKYRSEGNYRPFENDREDGYDTIEWIAQQPFCNGKVGMSGASAMGITANLAASAEPPHLVAAYVMVAPQSMFSESSFQGGVFKEADVGNWMKGQGADALVQELRENVLMGDRWRKSDLPFFLDKIKIPMYNVGGWYDIFTQGNINNFNYLQDHGNDAAKGKQKLLMGPFGHGNLKGDLQYPGAGGLVAAIQDELRWFDYWLKGEDNGIMKEPAVKYYMMASANKTAPSALNAWRTSDTWPPKEMEVVPYYLGKNLTLTTEKPKDKTASQTYVFDPKNPVKTVGGGNLTLALGPMDQRDIPERADYLRFQTPPLEKNVAIAGRVYVDLWAATDGPDTDFTAKLVDVYPDGYEAIVLDAPIRARYRKGRNAEDVAMMEVGKPDKLTIDLWSTAITFEKGHRIAVHVSSSNSPRFEVNPNTGEAPGKSTIAPRIANNTIYFDEEHPSTVLLPVLSE